MNNITKQSFRTRLNPTTMTIKDRQFYEMIIKDAKRILPMVDDNEGLCHILYWEVEIYRTDRFNDALYRVIVNIVASGYWSSSKGYYSRVPNRRLIGYRCTHAWKSDRIFLLNEIIKYCEYKLKTD
jgi:hypothetical protein